MSKPSPKPTGRRLVPLVVVTAPAGITLNDRDAGPGREPSDGQRPMDRTYPRGTALPAGTRPDLLDQFVRDGLAVRITVRVPIQSKES